MISTRRCSTFARNRRPIKTCSRSPTLKLDHFRHRDQRDLKDGWTERYPLELKDFWNRFNEWFFGARPGRGGARFLCGADARAIRRESVVAAVSVESQLIRHRAGYFLGPHSDLHTKLVVLLLYLRAG